MVEGARQTRALGKEGGGQGRQDINKVGTTAGTPATGSNSNNTTATMELDIRIHKKYLTHR
jgi:hypothetical protein